MARPRRSEHTKERLLDEGIRALSARGFHGAGLKAILDAVRVPKGSFYNYFESKDGFAAAIVDRYVDRLTTHVETFVSQAEDDPITIIRKVHTFLIMGFQLDHFDSGCLIGTLAADLDDEMPACRAALVGALDAWRAQLVTLLDEGRRLGLVRTDVPSEALAEFFWDAWEGSLLRAKVTRSPKPLEQCVTFLLDDFLRPRGA